MTYRYKEPKTEKPKPKTSFPFTGPDGKVHIAKRARFEENGSPYEIFHADDEQEVWLVIEPATHPFAYLLKRGINCDEERSRPMTHEEMQHLRVLIPRVQGGTQLDTMLYGAATMWMWQQQKEIQKIDEDPLGLGL